MQCMNAHESSCNFMICSTDCNLHIFTTPTGACISPPHLIIGALVHKHLHRVVDGTEDWQMVEGPPVTKRIPI